MNKLAIILFLSLAGLVAISCEGIEKNQPEQATEHEADSDGSTVNEPKDNGAGTTNVPETPPDTSPGEESQEPAQPELPDNPEDASTSGDVNDKTSYEFLSSQAPSVLSSFESDKVKEINSFAFSLLSEINDARENESFISSPLSLTYLLGMLAEGSDGATKNEICKALGFEADNAETLSALCRDLIVHLSRAAGNKESIAINNIVIADKPLNLLESYRERVKNYFDATTAIMDFKIVDVAGYANSWANEKTCGMIKKVLNKSDINEDTKAVLMNALYFSASWATAFEPRATKVSAFTGADGNTRSVLMMSRKDDYSILYAEDKECSMVRLPYGENGHFGNYSMYVMLPAVGVEIDKLAQRSYDEWEKLFSATKLKAVDLQIPRFSIDFDSDLTTILQHMGIKTAFTTEADFPHMTSNPLSINLIKQVARITVDEKGSEAAAVSVTVMDGANLDGDSITFIPFHADRPFLFAIKENTTGAVVFLGSYK